MRNKSIQNTNVQTNTKVQRKDDRQTDTCSENFTQIYSAKKNSTLVRNHTIHIVVSISANCKYIFNLQPNCLSEHNLLMIMAVGSIIY